MSAPTVVIEIEAPTDGAFILDYSSLDGLETLAGSPGEWQEYTNPATSIRIRRGGRRAALAVTMEVGSLTATFYNSPTPMSDPATFRPGVAIRARETTTGLVLFTGTIASILTNFTKDGDTIMVLAAHDATYVLANTLRYGAAHPTKGGEPWNQRVARLLSNVPLPFAAPPADVTAPTYWAANIVNETNVAAHLDLAVRSARRYWYVDRVGTIRIAEPGDPVMHASDVNDAGDPLHVSYVECSIGYDTTGVVNDLTLLNKSRVYDDTLGSWSMQEDTFGPYVNITSKATWGTRSVQVETAIYSGPDYAYTNLPDLFATAVLDQSDTPRIEISALTLDAKAAPTKVSQIELFDTITAARSDITQASLVVAIEHTITPRAWRTTLDLQEA